MEISNHFADGWIEAWNTHDIDRIMAHYADDVHFFSPYISKLAVNKSGILWGKQNLREYFEKAFIAYPNLHFELHYVLKGIDSYILVYSSVNDRIAGEMMEMNDAGQIVNVKAHYSL